MVITCSNCKIHLLAIVVFDLLYSCSCSQLPYYDHVLCSSGHGGHGDERSIVVVLTNTQNSEQKRKLLLQLLQQCQSYNGHVTYQQQCPQQPRDAAATKAAAARLSSSSAAAEQHQQHNQRQRQRETKTDTDTQKETQTKKFMY